MKHRGVCKDLQLSPSGVGAGPVDWHWIGGPDPHPHLSALHHCLSVPLPWALSHADASPSGAEGHNKRKSSSRTIGWQQITKTVAVNLRAATEIKTFLMTINDHAVVEIAYHLLFSNLNRNIRHIVIILWALRSRLLRVVSLTIA